MSIAERIASEKEPGQAIYAEHKLQKIDLSSAIYGNRRLK
jgi:hypothetical protein